MKEFGTQISAIGVAIAFVWGIVKFQAERRAAQFWKEYEACHKLGKELVQPGDDEGTMFADRQTAAIYELKFHKRYHEHSLRMLMRLREKWIKVPNQFHGIIEETDLTLDYLIKKRKWWSRWLQQ